VELDCVRARRAEEARENVRRNGVENLVQIEQADIFSLDLSAANVVFLFLLPRLNVAQAWEKECRSCHDHDLERDTTRSMRRT
jgi:tRNA A58 N-methylase Trm61